MNTRILLVTPYFYPEGGGLENYAYQVAKRLSAGGCEITVVCHSVKQPGESSLDGLRIVRLKPNWVVSNTPIRFNLLSVILREINRFKPDLIHAHTPVPFSVDVAARASRRTHIPLVVTYHTSTLFKNQFIFDLLVRGYLLFQRVTLSQASRIAAVTGNTDQTMSRWKNKTVVIPPGVDTERFNSTPYPQARKNLLLIAPLSRAYPSKGVDVLLRAMTEVIKAVPGAVLNIAGGGELTEHYRQMAERAGCNRNTHLLGKIPYAEMPRLMADNNIIVIPSIKSEGTPTVILEAQSAGRPVIGTRVGGIPELVHDGVNGYIVPPNDPAALSRCIISLLQQPERASQFGQAGRTQVEHDFTWDKITDKYIKLYHEVVG